MLSGLRLPIFRFLVYGMQLLVYCLGFWFLGFLASGCWLPMSGFWFWLLVFWLLESGLRSLIQCLLISVYGFLVPGFWCLFSGCWCPVPDARFSGLQFMATGLWSWFHLPYLRHFQKRPSTGFQRRQELLHSDFNLVQTEKTH